MKRLLALLLLLAAICLRGAIPEAWFADKARLGAADRDAIYACLPTRHQPIATLPEHLAGAFRERPADLTIHIGEAYFVDHCLNHHPEVPDAVYRTLQDMLDAPEEVILDRRGGKDGLLLTKRLSGTLYVLALRHYPAPQSQIAYKTLFPSNKRPYPNLPRFTIPSLKVKELLQEMVSSAAEPSLGEATVCTKRQVALTLPMPPPSGPLGCRTNPILCTSVPNMERYLAALRDTSGAPVRFRRFALLKGNGGVPVDGWLLRRLNGSDQRLYINPNASENTPFAPEGFTLSGFQPVHNETWLAPLLDEK